MGGRRAEWGHDGGLRAECPDASTVKLGSGIPPRTHMWNTCTSYLDVSGLAYSASQSLETEAVPLEEAYPAPLLAVEEHPRLQPISKSMSEDHVAVDIEVFGGTVDRSADSRHTDPHWTLG